MKLRRLALLVTSSLLLLTSGVGTVAAATTSAAKTTTKTKSTDPPTSAVATGSSGVQGYAADSALQIGTIVQLDKKDDKKVLVATKKDVQQMYGVAVDPHQLSLTLSDSKLAHETFVATAGTYDVLVSTQGGAIASGDYITLSSIDGVGMNATTDKTTVFGRAAASFTGKSDVIGTATLKDTSGKTIKNVSLGIIPVAINIQHNPNEKSTKANLPNALERAGQAVAQKSVSPARLYLGAVIAFLTVVVSVIMLYSGIRNSLISIGRNPLSKKIIFRGLLEVILAALVILIIGVFAVYLLLRL